MKPMKAFAFIAATLLSASAFADTADDYAACLIGYSVIALEHQGQDKDPLAAFGVARNRCPEPAGLDPEDEGREATFFLVEEIAQKVMAERMPTE